MGGMEQEGGKQVGHEIGSPWHSAPSRRGNDALGTASLCALPRGAFLAFGRRRSRGESLLAAVCLLAVTLCPLALLREGHSPAAWSPGPHSGGGLAGARELALRELGVSSRALSAVDHAQPEARVQTPAVGAGTSILMQGIVPGKPVPPAGWVADNAEKTGVKAAEADIVRSITGAVRDATDVRHAAVRGGGDDAAGEARTARPAAAVAQGAAEQGESTGTGAGVPAVPKDAPSSAMAGSERAAGSSGVAGHAATAARASTVHAAGAHGHIIFKGLSPLAKPLSLSRHAAVAGSAKGRDIDERGAGSMSPKGLSPLAKALVLHVNKDVSAAAQSAGDVARGKALIPSKLSKELTNVISQIVRQATVQEHGEGDPKMRAEAASSLQGGTEAATPEGADGGQGPSVSANTEDTEETGNLDTEETGNLDDALINATAVQRQVVGGVGGDDRGDADSDGWLAYKRVPVTYVAWLCAALCVVVTMLLSTKLILRHLEYYGNPDTQKYVVRILFMAPIYAVDSLLALTFVGWATTYIDVFRDCYEVCVWV
jgi:hypothetical protein